MDYAADTAQDSVGIAVVMALFIIPLLIATIVSYVIFAFFLSKIFVKAGVEGWKAWIPIYNTWIMLELGDQKGFWAVFALIPFVGLVSIAFMVLAALEIGKKLGKEAWFVLLYFFVTPVWLGWLAFDSSTWKGKKAPFTTTPDQTVQ